MNWILADDLAREHMDALRRAAANDRLARAATTRAAWRRVVGVKLVSAGLRMAAGVRAARAASDIVGDAVCGEQALVGEAR